MVYSAYPTGYAPYTNRYVPPLLLERSSELLTEHAKNS